MKGALRCAFFISTPAGCVLPGDNYSLPDNGTPGTYLIKVDSSPGGPPFSMLFANLKT